MIYIIILLLAIIIIELYLLINKNILDFKPTLRTTEDGTTTTNNNTVAIIILVLFLGTVLVIVGVSMYLSIKRYQLMGKAIAQGNTGTAIALAAPEIGSGIGSIFGGLTHHA